MNKTRNPQEELEKLASNEFGGLTVGEKKILHAAVTGEMAECGGQTKDATNLGNVENRAQESTVRARLLRWLCINQKASSHIDPNGLRIHRAIVIEELDLAFTRVPFPISLDKCTIRSGIDLSGAEMRSLNFAGSETGPIKGQGLTVNGDLSFCDGFLAVGEVQLLGATIKGNLSCRNGCFRNYAGNALHADRVKVGGNVFFDCGFYANGTVRLLGGIIANDLSCTGGNFLNLAGIAMAVDRTEIGQDVYFDRGFRSKGEVTLIGATIKGNLNCSAGHFLNRGRKALSADGVKVGGSIFLNDGFLAAGEVRLVAATVGLALNCLGGYFINQQGNALTADGVKVGRSVYFGREKDKDKEFRVEGRVSVNRATIAGIFTCSNGHFLNKGGIALEASWVEVGGNVYFNEDFRAEGAVHLIGAKINGRLCCSDGHFINADRKALDATGMKIDNDVILAKKFQAEGEVSFYRATIAGDLYCGGARVLNKRGTALEASWIEVGGNVFLNKCLYVEGRVWLRGAAITGNLCCTSGRFRGQDGMALIADEVEIGESVFFDAKFQATGEVRLHSATIGGSLTCAGGHFDNEGKTTLNADQAKIGGDVNLGFVNEKEKDREFLAKGSMRLVGARIGGNFNCSGGHFLNQGKEALNSEAVDVTGDVFLSEDFLAEGQVTLRGGRIGRNLWCDKATFHGNGENGLIATNATVKGEFHWKNVTKTNETTLDLDHATFGRLVDNPQCWPTKGNLHINGFVYTALDPGFVYTALDPWNLKTRLCWLKLHPFEKEECYSLQPYEQLAQVLRQGAHEDEAKRVAIARETIRRKYGGLSLLSRAKNWFLGMSIGHGYRPERAWAGALFFILLGWVLFYWGNSQDLMASTKINESNKIAKLAPGYQALSPLFYSLDAFLPIVDLHQEEYWLPDPNKHIISFNDCYPFGCGQLLRVYLWIHIAAGWLITTLLVISYTGLVRKD